MKLDHIGVAVNDLSATLSVLKAIFGVDEISKPYLDKEQKVNAVKCKLGDIYIQLVEPISDDTPISNFLKKRGEGLHHLCYEVENLEKSLEKLKNEKKEVIYEPFEGMFGHKYAFLSPADTGKLLIELVEKKNKQ